MDWIEVLRKIAVPRPDHSEALEQTAFYLKDLLTLWEVPYSVQMFPLFPYALALLGAGIVVLAVLFFIFIVKKRPVLALIALLLIPALIVLEMEFRVPVVSPLIQKPSENIIVNFSTPSASRELLFMAHYDSKTDFWDHVERSNILKLFPFFLLLGLALVIWTFLSRKSATLKKTRFRAGTLLVATGFLIYCGFAFSWLGGYIFMSDESASPGAIDDGASVVILLALAKDIHQGRVSIGDSNVTIVLTSGEEVGLQGARFYVNQRFKDKAARPELPTFLVNLELAGQNGNMIYWERVGSLVTKYEADPGLIDRLNRVWKSVSGKAMDSRAKIGDDSKAFGDVGLPFITVGHSGLPGLGLGDFHSPKDNMDRVNPQNIALMITTLEKFIESYN